MGMDTGDGCHLLFVRQEGNILRALCMWNEQRPCRHLHARSRRRSGRSIRMHEDARQRVAGQRPEGEPTACGGTESRRAPPGKENLRFAAHTLRVVMRQAGCLPAAAPVPDTATRRPAYFQTDPRPESRDQALYQRPFLVSCGGEERRGSALQTTPPKCSALWNAGFLCWVLEAGSPAQRALGVMPSIGFQRPTGLWWGEFERGKAPLAPTAQQQGPLVSGDANGMMPCPRPMSATAAVCAPRECGVPYTGRTIGTSRTQTSMATIVKGTPTLMKSPKL